jgi:UDP-2,3-diacylglucosamine hydrolase
MTTPGASQNCSPEAHLVQAPGHWQAIDFVSDLHLCEALPRTFDAFAQHLLHSTASAVCILGDLFEVWVGDDMGGRGFELCCVELMAQVSKRKQLAFMVGNRDFLVGNAFLQQTGCWSLPDPTVIEAWGHRCLLTHGDAWCSTDLPYQAFRRQVRSSAWQSEFLARPLDERLQIAAGIRSASKSRRQFDGAADADVDVATAVACMQEAGATTLVHGHTHRPSDDPLARGLQRHVLTDWDLDQGSRAQVLRWTAAGFARLDPTSSH